MKPPKRNPHLPRRKPNLLPSQTYSEKHFEHHVAAIGRANLAWNSLHEALALVFWSLTGELNGVVALAIWNRLGSDRAKKDILAAAAAANFAALKWDIENDDLNEKEQRIGTITREHDAIKFLCDESNKLENDRNNAIHAPLSWHILSQTVQSSSHQGNTRAHNLREKDVLLEIDRLYKTALLLRDFALNLEFSLRDEQAAWPERPRMPDRGGAKLSLPRPKK